MLGLSPLQIIAVILVSTIYFAWTYILCFGPRWVVKLPGALRPGDLPNKAPIAFYWAIRYTFLTCVGLVVAGGALGIVALLLLQVAWIDIPSLLKFISGWTW